MRSRVRNLVDYFFVFVGKFFCLCGLKFMEDLLDQLDKLTLKNSTTATMTTNIKDLEDRINELTERLNSLTASSVEIREFKETEIVEGIQCSETLDVVKSLPEFSGKIENYVSWRQAAHTAYRVFQKFDGSSKHYQAIAIIRNKITGAADAVLSSYNTVLNFEAIIARLDFTYSDKKPIHLIEQELSTLRQGASTVIDFYDEVEKKLSLLTNKTLMAYDRSVASVINDKYREDALRTFVSGLKKPLCDIIFSSRPSSLPKALALAQEVESNHERYVFAATFSNRREEKRQESQARNLGNQQKEKGNKNPHFSRNRQQFKHIQAPEPMDVDPSSSKFRQQTRYESDNPKSQSSVDQSTAKFKRINSYSDRHTGPKIQRLNHLTQENEAEYDCEANEACEELEEESWNTDEINFLGENPSCHS